MEKLMVEQADASLKIRKGDKSGFDMYDFLSIEFRVWHSAETEASEEMPESLTKSAAVQLRASAIAKSMSIEG